MNCSPEIKQISVALLKMQKSLKNAKKESENPFFKSKYADLASCWDAVKDALHKNGITLLQPMGVNEGRGYVETMLLHESGEYISGQTPIVMMKDDPQKMGSAITYARRYALAAITGLIQVDDDGETAMHRNENSDVGDFAEEHRCTLCGEYLKLSKSGKHYYCPNFKDMSTGEHPTIKAEQ